MTPEMIKRLREEKGITVNELANRMGVPQSYIIQLEQGQVQPTAEQIEVILVFLKRRLCGLCLTESQENEKKSGQKIELGSFFDDPDLGALDLKILIGGEIGICVLCGASLIKTLRTAMSEIYKQAKSKRNP